MAKFTMHAKEFKRMSDPVDKENGHTKYVCYIQASTIPMEFSDWMRTNPRNQKMTTDVAKAIQKSLCENSDFHELNRGIVLSAESVEFDNKNETVTIEMVNSDIHGNIDGGHTLKAILNSISNKTISEDRYVFAEIFVGLTTPVELAAARNTSVQVDLKSREELNKSSDILKAALSDLPFEKRIAYKMNQHYGEDFKPIDVREIITILNMFNQNLYPVMAEGGTAGESQPVQSYTGKEYSLKRFLDQGKEKREQIVKNMIPVTSDIFSLWDKVEIELPQKALETKHRYGSKKYSKYNGDYIGNTMLSETKIKYLVPKGILYPIVGAFRALIQVDTVTGNYSWVRDPFEAWDKLGPKLVAIVLDEKEDNPEYLGKSKNLWSNLFKEMLLYRLNIQ